MPKKYKPRPEKWLSAFYQSAPYAADKKTLLFAEKIAFFQKKPLQRAFSYYIILLLRSAQYGMRQKVAGGHFRVISADNRPTIGRSKGQMPENAGHLH